MTNVGSEPDSIDPQRESFTDEIFHTMSVFEALMTFDPKTLKPIPAAARDQPKISADGLTYTYTLRDGLKYSDGRPLAARDFKYGFTRLCDPATAGNYSFTGYIIVGCEAWNNMDPKKDDAARLAAARQRFQDAIKVIDDRTISFQLTENAPYFNSIAALWVGVPTREDAVQKGGDRWTEPPTFIGNGPFIMSEWKHNEKLVFTRNPNYRSPTQLAKWTRIMINEGAVAFAAYRNNQIDALGVAAEDLRTVAGSPELQKQLLEGGGSCTYYIAFNNLKAPFRDKNIRLAFAKSFDRDAFINDVQKIGKPALSFIPPGLPGYDQGDDAQRFDPAAAKAALEKADPSTKEALKTIRVTYAASARAKTRIEWFQFQWKTNLGVNVNLDPVDATIYRALVKRPETLPQVFFLGWCVDYPDQQDWLTTVFSSKASTAGTAYRSDEFDKLVFSADREPDPKRRDDLYLRASRLLSQDAPAAWLYYDAIKVLVKPWVKGLYISALGFETTVYTQVYVTKKS